jgi:SAM-dependent methyltransferase
LVKKKSPALIRLDLGCGTKKQEGHIGVDLLPFKGVDHVLDIGNKRWPFKNNSVDEAYSSHCIEHLTQNERTTFFNELYRVLKPGAKATIIIPYWASCRAYGDPTHEWPAVSELYWSYLSKAHRLSEAPAVDISAPPDPRPEPRGRRRLSCDFEATWGYGLHGSLQFRNADYQQFAVNHYKEAAQDMMATLTKRAG